MSGAVEPAPPGTELPPPHWVDHRALETTGSIRHGWLAAVAAIGEVVFESARTAPPRARLAWLGHQVEDFLNHVSAQSRLVFRLSVWAVTWLAPLMILRPVPIQWLAPATRARALDRFERSFLGLSLFAVKAILCIIYYEHPDAAEEIAFDGRCLVPGEEEGVAGTRAEGSP